MIRGIPRQLYKAEPSSPVHVGASIDAVVKCDLSSARFLFVGALVGAAAGAIALRPMVTGAVFGGAVGGVASFLAAVTY
jgi:hypothetical protein